MKRDFIYIQGAAMNRGRLSHDEISKLISDHSPANATNVKKNSLRDRLTELGADKYDLALPESRFMHLLIHPGEEILACVYGKYHEDKDNIRGRGVIIVTSVRVILIDKKPTFLRYDEFAYDAISGISISSAGPGRAIVLHTRFGDIHIRTFNHVCADNFVDLIQRTIFMPSPKPKFYRDVDYSLKP